MSWDFNPLAILGLAGVTPIDTSVAAVTVRLVDPVMPPSVAVTDADPGLNAVTVPIVPLLLPTAAIDGAEELQLTRLVMSCVELSV